MLSARSAQDPRQQLPVAPRPAVLTGGADQVVRRVFVEQRDIGHEARSGEDSFEQVVTQQGVLRHRPVHRRVEGIDVVDPLAGEAALLEEVLVDVGDGRRVGIDAGRSAEDALERRTLVLRWQRRRDPWLEQAVAVCHPSGPTVEARAD